jgi:hypothetical protein
MKDILLSNDDVNEKEIDNYIQIYGVDTPYNDPNSIYHNQTLLSVAISSNEINRATKLKLVAYLISKGAELNHTNTKKHAGLLCIALSDQHFELANLLLKEGASLEETYNNKNLIDIALDLKNEQVLLWVINNAKSLFLRLKTHEFNKYHQKIAAIFPNFASSELYQHLKKIAEELIIHKFDRLGLIDSEDAALILAAKMSKKPYKNSIFVITNDNIAVLIDQIKNLIEHDTNEKTIKFRIVYFQQPHVTFGEFIIDKTNRTPTVTYLHCDPSPMAELIEYFKIITLDFRSTISPLANIEIYDSSTNLQKGLGCSYFSIDGALMLATPPDRDYVTNLMEYMKKHGTEKNMSFKENNIMYVQSSLPTRFIRGSQFINDVPGEFNIKGLNSLIFNTAEKNTIVNKKGGAAEAVIRNDLVERSAKLDPNVKVIHNLRAERKMKKYGNDVRDFIKEKNVLSLEFSKLLDQYKIQGLITFCEEKVEKKKEEKINNKFKLII